MSERKLGDIFDADFEAKVATSDKPVVIDFWAPWCDPCKIVDPILEKMAEKYEGAVTILRMNVDEEKAKPAEYAVRRIPTILFFKQGELANQMIGEHNEESIEKVIESLL